MSKLLKIYSIDSVFPSIEGRVRGGSSPFDWKQILKLLIAVLTAIAGTLGVVSCMS